MSKIGKRKEEEDEGNSIELLLHKYFPMWRPTAKIRVAFFRRQRKKKLKRKIK